MSTILIIDDDEAIGNLEQEVLERAGYEVQRAFSGTETLLLLKQQRPDMILLDLMLPGISGEAWGIGFRWKLGFDGENANE